MCGIGGAGHGYVFGCRHQCETCYDDLGQGTQPDSDRIRDKDADRGASEVQKQEQAQLEVTDGTVPEIAVEEAQEEVAADESSVEVEITTSEDSSSHDEESARPRAWRGDVEIDARPIVQAIFGGQEGSESFIEAIFGDIRAETSKSRPRASDNSEGEAVDVRGSEVETESRGTVKREAEDRKPKQEDVMVHWKKRP